MKLNAPLFWLPMLLLALAACSPVQEEDLTVSVVYTIGDEYALVQATGYPPNRRLNEDMLRKLYLDYEERLGVKQMDVLVYDQGKQRGDGVRAWIFTFFEPGWPETHIWIASNQKQALGFERLGTYSSVIHKLYTRLHDNPSKFYNDFSGKEIKIWFYTSRQSEAESGQVCLDLESRESNNDTIRLCYDQRESGLEQFYRDSNAKTWSSNCVLQELQNNLAIFVCKNLSNTQ